MALKVGDTAPDVSGLLSDGTPFRLSDHRGATVILFFYPKDFTPGCTAEVCSFRDAYGEIAAGAKAKVFGVSRDDPASHRKFRETHHLPYELVTDDGSMSKAFGATWLGGLLPVSRRMTFVVDGQGVVRGFFHHEVLDIDQHVAGVKQVLGTLA
ncbi:MAG: peroxiredoxin [Myxococcales bacterium]|nr:peroxiredoxin [Myxococcales bacterium]